MIASVFAGLAPSPEVKVTEGSLSDSCGEADFALSWAVAAESFAVELDWLLFR
jgi:hypothetical protein